MEHTTIDRGFKQNLPALPGRQSTMRVRIGRYVTVLKDDGSRVRYLLCLTGSKDALGRAVKNPRSVVSTRDPLGRAIFNREIGDCCRFEDRDGPEAVWIEAIEPGPVF